MDVDVEDDVDVDVAVAVEVVEVVEEVKKSSTGLALTPCPGTAALSDASRVYSRFCGSRGPLHSVRLKPCGPRGEVSATFCRCCCCCCSAGGPEETEPRSPPCWLLGWEAEESAVPKRLWGGVGAWKSGAGALRGTRKVEDGL